MSATIDYPHDSGQEIVVSAEALKELMVQMFVRKGMFKPEAVIGASRLIEADLRGIQSHGSRAIGRYLAAMDLGNIDPRAQTITEVDTPAMAVLDGGKGLGHVAATRAMELAIAKARDVGTGTVAVKRSQHFGAASVYVLMAIEAGMIGYATTSTGPATVAPLGGLKPATANNALAWGAPTGSGAPFVLDMACAVTSWGKLESLGLYGLPVPEGWALDAAGQPTSDPRLAKMLTPAAGARGYGLAFLSSVLAGALVGGKMPIHKTRAPEVEGSEHFFYVVDVSKFVDPEKYFAEIDSAVRDIRAIPAAEGFDRVRVPGELEWERAQQWKEQGLPIHRTHAQMLEELAEGMGLQAPWA